VGKLMALGSAPSAIVAAVSGANFMNNDFAK
jgi:hypothetical protein